MKLLSVMSVLDSLFANVLVKFNPLSKVVGVWKG